MSHRSQSGPVIVTQRFEPSPATPQEQLMRLKHKLALIEDRIADREAYARHRGRSTTNQIQRLLNDRDSLKTAISSFGE